MKQIVLLIVCMLGLNVQAQVYSFETQKTYQGNVRMGDEICLTDNPNQNFSFGYLPKVGNTYLSILMFMLSSTDEEINKFLVKDQREIHSLAVKLTNGKIIELKDDHWDDKTPLSVVFVNGGGMIISMGFIDTELNGQSITITNKTKEKEKIKWINQIKTELIQNDISTIEIKATYKEADNNSILNKVFHYDITSPTTYIFKSLMYDEKLIK